MMNLPDLPKRRTKREADVTPRVLDWFRSHHNGPCAIEIKATGDNSIPRSALEPHQRTALLAASTPSGVVHKISDQSRGSKPFDAFKLSGVPAYVVAAFTKKGIAYAIPVSDWRGARFDMPPSSYFRRIEL